MNRPPARFIGKAILFGLAFGALAVFATQFLWNALAVAVFGLPALTFLQIIGLMLLGRLLTGGFGRGGGGWHRGRWMREKWANMSETEQQEMKLRWRSGGCRNWGEPEATPAAEMPVA